MASRPVPRSEVKQKGPEGEPQKAMDDEWGLLIEQKCFDFLDFGESWEVTARSRSGKRKPCHIGLVFGICVEKAYHLKKSDKRRRYKGRYVYQGNNVRDEWHQHAVVQELSCHPASMEASKCLDAYGCLPGHIEEQGDAKQAFTGRHRRQ